MYVPLCPGIVWGNASQIKHKKTQKFCRWREAEMANDYSLVHFYLLVSIYLNYLNSLLVSEGKLNFSAVTSSKMYWKGRNVAWKNIKWPWLRLCTIFSAMNLEVWILINHSWLNNIGKSFLMEHWDFEFRSDEHLKQQLHKEGSTRGVQEPQFFCIMLHKIQQFQAHWQLLRRFPILCFVWTLSLEFEQTQHFWPLHGDYPVLQVVHIYRSQWTKTQLKNFRQKCELEDLKQRKFKNCFYLCQDVNLDLNN